MKIEDPGRNELDCHCRECGDIHSEFIGKFRQWPKMGHEEGQRLKQRRIENEQSWRDAIRGELSG